MKLWDLLRIANRNLFRAKLRTFLTVAAIFIGSFTLTLTNGLGDGLRDYVEKQVKNIEGKNILMVRKQFPREKEDAPSPDTPHEYKEEKNQNETKSVADLNSANVSLEQINNLKGDLPQVKNITPDYFPRGEFITLDGEKKYNVFLGMLSEGVIQKAEAGKTIDGEGQIMIPLMLARGFDENINNLVGKTATIAYKTEQTGEMKSLPLKIVGVSTKGLMTNIVSFVDAKTAKKIYDDQNSQKPFFNKFSRFTFLLNTSDEKQIAEVKNKLAEKGFSAETFADNEKRTYDAIGILQIGLNFFAFIALLAASFGIINTLVIAVLERTKEVGLQKALGMNRGKIFLLFSFESILIGFWGAVIGIVSGIVVGKITNFVLANKYAESFEGYSLFVFTPFAVSFVLLLVCGIAFVAGVLPAFRASRLNPIEALRYE